MKGIRGRTFLVLFRWSGAYKLDPGILRWVSKKRGTSTQYFSVLFNTLVEEKLKRQRIFPPLPSTFLSICICRRYTHEIAFIGRDTVGNVQTLAPDINSCSTFIVSGGGESGVRVETLNEGEALGTGTSAKSVKVTYSTRISFDDNFAYVLPLFQTAGSMYSRSSSDGVVRQ